MFNKKKKIIIVIGCLVLGVFVYVFSPKAENYLRWKIAVEAAGGFPFQIGLTNIVTTPCVLVSAKCTPIFPLSLCDSAPSCLDYETISGTWAGGMGSSPTNAKILVKYTTASQAGLIPGGQLIAGGMGPTLMDSGVVAGVGGCAGCVAAETVQIKKFKNWFAGKISNFIIAGSKDN